MLVSKRKHHSILIVILILSAYVHLWNPAGFPDLFFDEGIYMRRAVTMAETGNPQEASFYDHPYFGQIILAGFVNLVGFPETVKQSLEASYLMPRILMGIFAVLDTFLIYKISEKKFGKRTAVLASVLFAVMPITWMFRRILLDSILMPFLLSSILLALYSRDYRHPGLLVLSSSVLLGLAIFTKVTAITMIPVVAFIIASGHGSKWLMRWFPGVFAVPLTWPAIATYLGHLDIWFQDVLWQAGRSTGQFLPITVMVLGIDPVTVGLGFAGIVYAMTRRDVLLILWSVPFLLFVGTIGFLQYFHYMIILPSMCVSAAYMIHTSLCRVRKTKLQNYAYVAVVVGLLVYGVTVSTSIISADLTSAQFLAMQYVIDTFDDEEFTLLAGPVYTWILDYVYRNDNVFLDYSGILYYDSNTTNEYLVVDAHFEHDLGRGEKLGDTIKNSTITKTFLQEVPDAGYLRQTYAVTGEGEKIEIRLSGVAP